MLPTEALCQAFEKHGSSVISVTRVADEEVSKYGIISTSEEGTNGLQRIAGIVEKPEQGDVPSNLASLGRYVFESEIFGILRSQEAGHGGEIQLADAINTLANSKAVFAQTIEGARYDCGSKFGYLEAIVDTAMEHEEYSERFRALLELKTSLGDVGA